MGEEAPSKKASMVESLLAKEAQRKKENELKQQQEEATVKKMKELQAMSIDNLKKALSKKGKKEAIGKKDDLIKALFTIYDEERKLAERKTKLQSLALDGLKKLASKHGLPMAGKEKMIE